MKFKVDDNVMYEKFHYSNTCQLIPPYSGPYKILNKLSDVSFKTDKPNPQFKWTSEFVHSSKLRFYNDPQNFKLHYE